MSLRSLVPDVNSNFNAVMGNSVAIATANGPHQNVDHRRGKGRGTSRCGFRLRPRTWRSSSPRGVASSPMFASTWRRATTSWRG